jgi:hypothetical protein
MRKVPVRGRRLGALHASEGQAVDDDGRVFEGRDSGRSGVSRANDLTRFAGDTRPRRSAAASFAYHCQTGQTVRPTADSRQRFDSSVMALGAHYQFWLRRAKKQPILRGTFRCKPCHVKTKSFSRLVSIATRNFSRPNGLGSFVDKMQFAPLLQSLSRLRSRTPVLWTPSTCDMSAHTDPPVAPLPLETAFTPVVCPGRSLLAAEEVATGLLQAGSHLPA